ncbi:unnamed protein product [Choristocarpus tenellus]
MTDEGGGTSLVQFLLLAKTSKGRACVALIQQVLSNKKSFVFGELMAMPNIQALRGTEHEPHLLLLEIFAYGTFTEYQSKAAQLPELTPVQMEKLRMLSIVSLAHEHKVVPYTTLKNELGMDNVRQLEDLIFDTIYSGLVQGKLDQLQGILKVKYAIARDVRIEDLGLMMDKLGRWATAAQVLLATMEGSVEEAARVRGEETASINLAKEMAADVKKNLKDILAKQKEEDGYHDIGYDIDIGIGGERHSMRRGRSKRNRVPGMSDHRPRNK